MRSVDYDAIVVGSGPNGLAAAIYLQQQGLAVLLVEAKDTIGGGMRSAALTLPGYLHDICSAVHPMAQASPFFSTLPLQSFGLEFLQPEIPAAHPFDDGVAALLHRSLQQTAEGLGNDQSAYLRLLSPIVKQWPVLISDLLAPLHVPSNPLPMAGFGLKGLASATRLAKRFSSREARGLFAGMAAHAIQPLESLATSAVGLVLMAAGHSGGWPIPKGGSQQIANALGAYFQSIGGTIETGIEVKRLQDLPSAKAILFDLTPRQLLRIAGHRFSSLYRWQLSRYQYGMGVFKMDFAIEGAIPFTNPDCRKAGTVHLGGTFEEIAAAERSTAQGNLPDNPFVLLAQPGITDPSRAPEGKQVVWAYCHVPNGSTQDRSAAIEAQIERFAPGFRDRILARHTYNTAEMESYNPNYIGGDINGGAQTISQLFTRPALRCSPYKTSAKGLYLCSSATPPGGGVHGMCGYHAARRALKDCFPEVYHTNQPKTPLT